jgi:CRP-like cAMP-binding protein
VNNIEAHQYMAEALIIKQGQKATHLYILASGECEVLVKDQFKKE